MKKIEVREVMVTIEILTALGKGALRSELQKDVVTINKWADRFGLTSKVRMAHFLAQCAHESGGFRFVRELSSGKQYEGRKDLGNVFKGDGERFKGRGYMQLTGRANYRAYRDSGFCVGDVVLHPELLEQSPGRMKSAMWFWWKSGLNLLADQDNGKNTEEVLMKITRKVNGGLNGLASRRKYLEVVKKLGKL